MSGVSWPRSAPMGNSTMRSELRRVTEAFPCPIYHKGDWCRIHPSGAFAICNRIESPEPASLDFSAL